MIYSVGYAKSIHGTQVELLPRERRAELDAHVRQLQKDPFPGHGVFRLRVSGALRGLSAQPLYAARTPHLIVYHTVQDDRVVILGVFSADLAP